MKGRSDFAEDLLDLADLGAVDRGYLCDGHAVLELGADARKMRARNCRLRPRIGTADRGFHLIEPYRWWRDYAENTRFTLRQIS